MDIITLPGLIDPHVHLRDPGQTHKEDFYTGTCAALAGGYTTILDMPNNKIPITTLERLEEKINIAKNKIVCDVGMYFGCVSRQKSDKRPFGSLNDNLDEFQKIYNKVFGLKLYLNETTGNFLIDKKSLNNIFHVWNSHQPILLHAEDKAVSAVIQIVRKTGKRAHFCHISTSSDLKQIIAAKENALPVTCGVTPHHLFLNDKDAKKLGAFGKMKPPLRKQQDVDFLWKNLKYIDVIESDHAPHTKDEKSSNNPPYGVPGLETTLPLLLTAVSQNRLTMNDIIRLCHTGPKECFHVSIHHNTTIEIDLDKEWIVKGENLQTKCKWSPFEGWKMRGKVKRVFLRGEVVFEDGKVLAKPGFAKIVRP